MVFERVAGKAAGLVLGGARRQGSEHHQRLRMFGNGVERAGATVAGLVATKDVAQYYGTGGDRIGVDVAGKAACEIEHALKQGGRVVEPAATGPAI
jgi:hypothetical protein